MTSRPPRRNDLARSLLALLLAAGSAVPLQVAAATAAQGSAPRLESARIIVKFKADAAGSRASAVHRAAELMHRTGLALADGRVIDRRLQVIVGDTSMSSAQLARRLETDPGVEYAVADERRFPLTVPNDPLYAASISSAGQWYLQAPDAAVPAAIDAPGAWSLTTGMAGIVVADLDTGVRFQHPDLSDKLLAGYSFFSWGTAWSADASDPGDYAAEGQCGSGKPATDSTWHGTQTAGLLGAATDNGVGMASIGHDTMVLPVRVLGPCGGHDSDIIAGMLWAAGLGLAEGAPAVPPNTHPARVLNLSLGSEGSCSRAYADAVSRLTAAGVIVVAAAGNTGTKTLSPANCPGVIAVTGLGHTGTKASYSNLGPEVAIAAPSGDCGTDPGACLYPILTTTNSGTTTPSADGDGYGNFLGTSYSAPLVAGTVALMLAADPQLTPAQVKQLLQSSATPFPERADLPACRPPSSTVQQECACTTSTCGAGMLQAAAAVRAAAALAQPAAVISAPAGPVVAGADLTLDGTRSLAPSGRTLAAYQWSLPGGSDIAGFVGATNTATATLHARQAGRVTVQLTVWDDSGAQASATVVLDGAAPSSAADPGLSPGGTGSAGGGATDGATLLGLVAALALLLRHTKA